MDKRKLILLFGSFGILLAVLGLYSLIGPGTNITDDDGVQTDIKRPQPKKTGSSAGQSPEPIEGTSLWTEDRDPYTGKLKRIYRVKKWNKTGQGIYDLVEPNVLIYQRNGQQVTITADRGRVVGEEIAGKPKVQSGLLEGNVRIFFDRDDEVARHDADGKIIPAEKRPNVVRIYVDSLWFDASDLEIYTDSKVSLFSKEADIFGTGLRLLWKENPQELRRLEIKEGDRMVVHQASGSRQILAVPGKETSGEPADGKPETVKIVSTAPADTQPETSPDQDRKRKNIFQAEFFAQGPDITVIQQEQALNGARRLAMQFEFAGSTDTSQPNKAPEKPQQPQVEDVNEQDAAITQTTVTRKAPATKPADEKPLIITWDGPLVLQPVGYVENPSSKRYSLEAQGPELSLTDTKTNIICQEIKYHNFNQSGEFLGSKDGTKPALIKLEGGELISAPLITFNRIDGVANLVGEGYMTRPVDEKKEGGEKITWKESVLVDFLADSDSQNRLFIKKATFKGDVLLTQEENIVRGENIVVAMGKTHDGKVYPTRADVTGNAFATQESSNISAEHISVTFRPVAGTSGKAVVKGYSQSARVEPVELKANGNVRITDKRGDDLMFANADELVSDLIVAKATLKGNPAQVGLGENILSGQRIDMWQREFKLIENGSVIKKHYVNVTGEGNLVFLTDRGMNSAKLDKPRKIRVGWTERMSYYPQQLGGSESITDRNLARFHGNVEVTSLNDRLAAQFLEVQFREELKKDAPKETTDEQAKRTGAVEIAEYSDQKIVKMNARDNVEMSVVEKQDDSVLLRRMVVNGDELVYDVPTGVVNMFSGGTLMNEDYRQPKEGSIAASDAMETNVDRPNLTSFTWSDSMVLNQNARQAVLKGNVSMNHRSGSKVVDLAKLSEDKLPQWGRLPAGRHTKIRCEDMLVQFDEPSRDKKTSTDSQEPYDVGAKIGALNLFKAKGNVRMEDGPRQVISQILIYDRVPDIVKIYGYIEGLQSPANAMLVETNIKEMTEKQISSPVIIWYRQNNEIRTMGISAGG